MISDSDMISTIAIISRLKGAGIGLFNVWHKTDFDLSDIIEVWDKCGPPVLSQEKTISIRKHVYSDYSNRKIIVTEKELENIAFDEGVSMETARKIICNAGSKVSANYPEQKPKATEPKFIAIPNILPAAHARELPISTQEYLIHAFFDRQTEEQMSKDTGIPVSKCRIYRKEIQQEYNVYLRMHDDTNLTKFSQERNLNIRIVELFARHEIMNRENSLATSSKYARFFTNTNKP